MAESRKEAWDLQGGWRGKGRHGTTTSKINRRHSNKQRAIQTVNISRWRGTTQGPHEVNCKKPHEKNKEPLPGVCHGGAL